MSYEQLALKVEEAVLQTMEEHLGPLAHRKLPNGILHAVKPATERACYRFAIKRCGNNRSRCATFMGVARETVRRWCNHLDIEKVRANAPTTKNQ